MKLHGQDIGSNSENGYAMAALLVAFAIMGIMLTVAMPVWKTATKREKEAELIWRAGQYVRAIMLFQRKYANAYPPNVDILLNEHLLRKKYKDPITGGDFQLIPAASQQQRPVEAPGGPMPPSQSDQRSSGPAGTAVGGIVGVASKSTETSLKVFNGRTKYNEWAFTPQTLGLLAPGTGTNQPGGNQPVKGLPGQVGAGGTSRGQLTLDRFGRPTQSTQPTAPRPFGAPTPPRPPE